jgi:hypothetical protein
MNQVRIKMDTPSAKSFATRLTHTSPPEYIEANVSGGKLKLKRVKNPPNCELLTDDNVAFRLSNLWARQEIEKLAVSGDINEACNVANIYRIVSSVSGATVLEENFDYSNNGLNRDQYRTIGHEASTGSNFTHAVGFVPYSANVNSVNQGMRGVAIGAPGPEAPVLQGASFGTAAPMLQGATNGTIGPQGADATVIMGVNTAGTVRVNNLVLLENWLNVIASTVQIIGVALAAFMMSEAALNKGLKAPVQLSRVKTFWLALFVGTSAYFTPTGINALMAWMRDMNLFS